MSRGAGVALLVVLAAWVALTGAGRPAVRLRRAVSGAPPTSGGTSSTSSGRWRRREPPDEGLADPALVLDLVASAMSAGAPPVTALAVVGAAVGGSDGRWLRVVADRLRLGADEAAAWQGTPARHAVLRRCLALVTASGAPGAALLRDHATQVRRHRDRLSQAAAHRLGVRVVLPLGLCALPGFAAWGVVPVVLGLAATVLSP